MLSIVIVNWNGGELLLRCLRSIRASRTTFPVKVIVVDNDSHDGSREAAQGEFPEYHIFNSGSNLGFGRANNLARPLVETPLVLFLNPDTELMPETLEKMVGLMGQRPEVGAAGCLMRYPDGTVQEQGLQWYPTPLTVFLELVVANRAVRQVFWRWLPRLDPLQSSYARKLYGGFVMARKDVLDQAGWFDDRYFMYAEDVDLSRTIASKGWQLYYSSAAEILHVSGGTSAKASSGFSVLMKNESLATYMSKYYSLTGNLLYRLAILIAAVCRTIVLVTLVVFTGQSASRWHASLRKQGLMIQWAVGLKKPVVLNSHSKSSASV